MDVIRSEGEAPVSIEGEVENHIMMARLVRTFK